MVLQQYRADRCYRQRRERRKINTPRRDALKMFLVHMPAAMTMLVLPQPLHQVLRAMRDDIEPHKQQKHAHREPRKHLRPFKPKRVSYRAPLPHLKVTQNIDCNT